MGTSIAEAAAAMCGLSCVEVQVWRDLAVLQHQHHLDQPGDAGGGFRVSDVRLHRAEQRRSSDERSWHSTAPSAPTSIGSPSSVPVPWAST